MVSPRILAQIRKTAQQFLTDTCSVYEEETMVDEFGDSSRTLRTVAIDAACRIIKVGQNTTSAASITSNREDIRDEYKLSVLRTTPLSVDYRIKHDDVEYDVVRIETSLTDEVFHHAILQRRI